jgi:pimeloyl-ACP methyl ester carboxylesterase
MALNVVHVPGRGDAKPHPILFVHGAWHAAWCWGPFMEWFAERGWDCHAVDLRGHGSSSTSRPLRFVRIKHYVEDLGTAAARLDRPPLIVAHSMGSLVAQRYLEGKWLPGAVLLNPVPLGGVWRTTFRVMRRHPGKFLKANLTLSLGPLVEDAGDAAALLFPDDMAPDAVDAACRQLQAESYLAYLDMLLFVRARPPLVPTPVAIVTAGADALFSVDEHRKLANAYGTELRVIQRAAHDSMLGPTWEATARAVTDAIASF